MTHSIDFSSPSHQLPDILFDVKLQEVSSSLRFPDTLFKQPIYSPHYRAIVNQNNGRIISIVGKNYRLVTNSEALEIGKRIFTQLYPYVNSKELIPYKVVAPNSMASAHIDLIHKDVNFNFWEQESWLPFLRVTNSYNRTYALSFEIGFVRKLCSNGVLFNKKSMKLKYVHTSNKIKYAITDASQIEATSKYFEKQCQQLRIYEISKELIFPLVCHIMNVNLKLGDKKQWNKKLNYLKNLSNLVKTLSLRYYNDRGLNAYTILNVVTDIASHQDVYKNLIGYHFNVRSFYTRPTDWAEDFMTHLKKKDFSIDNYLINTTDALKNIETETGFKWYLN